MPAAEPKTTQFNQIDGRSKAYAGAEQFTIFYRLPAIDQQVQFDASRGQVASAESGHRVLGAHAIVSAYALQAAEAAAVALRKGQQAPTTTRRRPYLAPITTP